MSERKTQYGECKELIPQDTPFEIRKTQDGRIFGIKNIRQQSDGKTITYSAEVCGDLEAGNEYLRDFVKGITSQFQTIQFQPKVEDEN